MKRRSKNLEIAREMPPLHHSFRGRDFDIMESEVVGWLISQPEILNYVWNNIKNSGDVVYDSDTGMWQGVDVDYEGDET